MLLVLLACLPLGEKVFKILDAAPSPLCWQPMSKELGISPHIFSTIPREMKWNLDSPVGRHKFPVKVTKQSATEIAIAVYPLSWKKPPPRKSCTKDQEEIPRTRVCPDHNPCDIAKGKCRGPLEIFARSAPGTVLFGTTPFNPKRDKVVCPNPQPEGMNCLFDRIVTSFSWWNSDKGEYAFVPKLSYPYKDGREDWCNSVCIEEVRTTTRHRHNGTTFEAVEVVSCDCGGKVDWKPTNVELLTSNIRAIEQCTEYLFDDVEQMRQVAAGFACGVSARKVLYTVDGAEEVFYGYPVCPHGEKCKYKQVNAYNGMSPPVNLEGLDCSRPNFGIVRLE
eukprot:c11358_g1_i1.p1 GENE.c11358_g1_i1~~c11358_g1_i1.p1  ORF type:complete len:335 (-),score=80.94 c11358_g1_i1:34-1038(-)